LNSEISKMTWKTRYLWNIRVPHSTSDLQESINILNRHCTYILAPKITKLWFGFEIFWRQNIGKNAPAKCWWNNTSKRERTHSIKVLNSTFEQMELNSCCVHLFAYGNEEDKFFEVTSFSLLHFGFVIFWRKDIGEKKHFESSFFTKEFFKANMCFQFTNILSRGN